MALEYLHLRNIQRIALIITERNGTAQDICIKPSRQGLVVEWQMVHECIISLETTNLLKEVRQQYVEVHYIRFWDVTVDYGDTLLKSPDTEFANSNVYITILL